MLIYFYFFIKFIYYKLFKILFRIRLKKKIFIFQANNILYIHILLQIIFSLYLYHYSVLRL